MKVMFSVALLSVSSITANYEGISMKISTLVGGDIRNFSADQDHDPDAGFCRRTFIIFTTL